MIVDATITIGNIIEIAVISGGGVATLAIVKNSVTNLRGEIKTMKFDFIDVKAEIKKLSEVMVDMADIRGEIKLAGNRITAAEQDIRELRHGEGFIRGPRGVDREYP